MYNILVVDDDKEIVESIEIYLKNEGFNIFKAYNGIEALEIIVEKEIHLILMDIGNYDNNFNKDILKSGGLELNISTKEVKVDGEVVKITPIEFKILKLLLSNKGRVFSIDEIYEKVWNEESFNVENTVAVHIRRIREKIEINPKEPRYLKVVWGVGYKIEKL